MGLQFKNEKAFEDWLKTSQVTIVENQSMILPTEEKGNNEVKKVTRSKRAEWPIEFIVLYSVIVTLFVLLGYYMPH